ncbi:3-oxoacyl-[acyl-carrier-protein] reductase [Nocardioides panacihumi]|uniref:3-oxoacyl-[acyl-carrier-protein] reductase n=1 Tax=Nocardioides panacihumi TaxID=400774 RepID=A0ABN2QUP5_9ACTN
MVNDLDEAPAKETVEDIIAAGGQAVACVGSVTAADFAQRFVDTAVESFGGLDIIVNNAGYIMDNVIQRMTDEQWDGVLDMHLTAPFKILRAAAPYIKENPTDYHRKVVNVSSVSGVFGNVGQANYAAAKAGVIGFTKTMAKEWGRYKVNVNAVAFGFILTRMTEAVASEDTVVEIEGRKMRVGVSQAAMESVRKTNPLGRPGTPEEAAGAVYALCLPEMNYVSGQCITVDAGSR